MSVIQPQILYTGQNAAIPDFKGMTRDIQAIMAQVDRERQQQRQFDQQRQDQLNREFLKSLDIDQINFTNNKLKEKSVGAYNSLNEFATDILQQSGGRASTQDIMKVRSYANSMQQEMMKYKNWEDNWNKDKAAIINDKKGLYNKDAAKEKVFGWDGSTPYNESKLEIAPWDEFRLQNALEEWTGNANKLSTFSYFNSGQDLKTEGEYTQKFWKTTTDESGQIIPLWDENGNPIPDYKEQGKFYKGLLEGNDFLQGRLYVQNEYEKLSKEDQKRWDDRAANVGLTTQGQGDGEIMYMMADDGLGLNTFKIGKDYTAYKENKESDKNRIPRNESGERISVLTTSRDTSFDGKKYNNVYDLPKGVQLQEGVNLAGVKKIEGGKEIAVSEDEAKTFDNPTLIAVNTDKDGKVDKIFLRTRSPKYKTTTKGEQIYKWGDETGTEDMLYEKIAKQKGVDVSEVSPTTKSYYKNSFFEPVESGSKYNTIVVPASENKYLLNTIQVKGSTGYVEQEKQSEEKYTYNGNAISLSAIEDAANKSGMSIEEYIQEAGIEKQ